VLLVIGKKNRKSKHITKLRKNIVDQSFLRPQ
jgi:hypothetical protein